MSTNVAAAVHGSRHTPGGTDPIDGYLPSVPTVVLSLASTVSAYHQAPNLIASGTFVAPAARFRLKAQISGYVNGADYSGHTLQMVVGVPAGGGPYNCGGIVGDEVNQCGLSGVNPTIHDTLGTALYPVSGTAGVRGAMVNLGAILGEFASGCVSREVVYDNAVPGTTYTVQLFCNESSGLDQVLAPSGSASNTWGRVALTPKFDTSPDNNNPQAVDLWVVDATAQALLRYSMGRRPVARYDGIQPRLLYKNSLAMPNALTFASLVIDKNGKAAAAGKTGQTVTIVDTTANNRAGSVLVTTSALGATVDDVRAARDGSGFWVALHDTSLVKIDPTTGATITTLALSGYGTMTFTTSLDGSVAYLWSSVNGLQTINLTTGAATAGPSSLANVNTVSLSPDGLSLLVAAGLEQSWAVAKVPLSSANANMASGATITYASRIGTQLSNLQVYSLAFSADSKMFFASGLKGVWLYGWVNNMNVFDGQSAEVVGKPTYYLAVTDNDGLYVAKSGGTSPAAGFFAFPGSTFTCDPLDTFANGLYFAEVVLT